jgi:hypothetical protein
MWLNKAAIWIKKGENYMKNRVKLIVALLASVLVVCGMFTMTTFADDPAPAHVHTWKADPSQNMLGVYCNSNPECPEYPGYTWFKACPQDKVYDGEAYDSELIGAPVVDDMADITKKAPDATFGAPKYSKGDTELTEAPVDKGEYKVTVPLKIGDQVLGNLTGTFSIKEFTVEVPADGYWYGETVSPVAKIGGSSEFDRKTYMVAFEYLSLDKRNAKYDAKKPKDAGHYRVKAYLYQYVGEGEDLDIEEITTATADFEIKRTSKTANDNFRLVFLKDIKGLAKIDPEAIDFSSPEELEKTLQGLASKDIITETGEYGMPVVVIPVIGDNHIVYSLKKFGPLTVKYSKAGSTDSKLFVPGVTLLPVGKYDFTVIIGGSKNNERIVLKQENVNIAQTDPKWLVHPTPKKGLVFNDTYQKLINPGTATGAKVVLYAIDSGSPETTKWSKAVPTAREAGTYKVLFKVIPKNDNYTEDTKGSMDVKIAETPADVDDDEDEEVSILAPDKVKQLKVTRKGSTKARFRFRRTKNDYFDVIQYEYLIKDAKGNVVKRDSIDQDITKYIYKEVTGLTTHTKYSVKVRAIGTINSEEEGEKPIVLKGEWSKAVNFRTK